MEKDIGKIKKNETTDIIVRVDDYKGKKGLTIREYITSEKYTGFSKSGTRIPADEFLNFRDIINSISLDEMTSSKKEEAMQEKPKKTKKPKKEKIEETEEQDIVDETEEAEVKEEPEKNEESEEESEESE